MIANQINLQQKFSVAAKAAYDRLLTQTLWETHPASFYHSATQELICLVKYYLRKNNEWHDGDYIDFKWRYEESKEIVVTEGTADTDRVHAVCEYTSGGWDIEIKINRAAANKENICDSFIKIFIDDIHKLMLTTEKAFHLEYEYSHLGDAIRKLTEVTKGKFKALTNELIDPRIMLYCAKNKDRDGFLYYPDYNLTGESIILQNEKAICRILNERFIDKIGAKNKDKYRDILTPVNDYLAEKIKCLLPIVGQSLNTIRSSLLTHPVTFLTDNLQGKSSCSCCDTPVCNQPIGMGLAGIVAKSGITSVWQTIDSQDSEKDLDIETIIDKKVFPYALMRMIEQAIEVNKDRRAIISPLYGKGQLIGVLYATKKKDDTNNNFFNSTQVEIFESIAHKVGNILQEIRDYEYFKSLIEVKAKNNTLTELEIIELIVNKMEAKLRLVLNVFNTDSWSVALSTGSINKLTMELCSSNELHIYLPAVKHEKMFNIKAYFDDGHANIFEVHREKLEVFFNYCWGLTGYISPEVQHDESEEESTDGEA